MVLESISEMATTGRFKDIRRKLEQHGILIAGATLGWAGIAVLGEMTKKTFKSILATIPEIIEANLI